MRSPRRPLALMLAAALVLAACGSDDDDGQSAPTTEAAPSTTTEPREPDDIESETLDRVAGDICSAIDTWSAAIAQDYDATPGALAGAQSTAAARTVVIEWMASMSAHTETLIEDLRQVDLEGAEPLESFRDDLGDRFATLNDIVESHEQQASELSTDDPETFGDEVTSLVDEFNTALAEIPTVFEDLDQSYPSAELQAALGSACALDPLGDDPSADTEDPRSDETETPSEGDGSGAEPEGSDDG